MSFRFVLQMTGNSTQRHPKRKAADDHWRAIGAILRQVQEGEYDTSD